MNNLIKKWARNLDTSPKKINRWQTSTRQGRSTSLSPGKCSPKPREAALHTYQNGPTPVPAGTWGSRSAHFLLVGCRWAATLEDSPAVSYKAKHALPVRSSTCAPRYLPEGAATYVPTKPGRQMLTAAVFRVTKPWKQPRCPFQGRWANTLWSGPTMEHYSVRKRNELRRREKAGRDLGCIGLSERNQSQCLSAPQIPVLKSLPPR